MARKQHMVSSRLSVEAYSCHCYYYCSLRHVKYHRRLHPSSLWDQELPHPRELLVTLWHYLQQHRLIRLIIYRICMCIHEMRIELRWKRKEFISI